MSQSTAIQHAHEASLYERLGGAGGIEALVSDILAAHMRHPVIKNRFVALQDDPARFDQVKQHVCDFFSAGTGGPDAYTGRSMTDAHRGMNINEAEYIAVIDDIMAALQKHGIDESTQKDVLAIAYSLKEQIVHG